MMTTPCLNLHDFSLNMYYSYLTFMCLTTATISRGTSFGWTMANGALSATVRQGVEVKYDNAL